MWQIFLIFDQILFEANDFSTSTALQIVIQHLTTKFHIQLLTSKFQMFTSTPRIQNPSL